jgi:hypothetical protein
MAMNEEPQVFLFLSEILGKKIVDAAGQPLGTVFDLTAAIGEIYPVVTGILLGMQDPVRLALLPWQGVTFGDGKLVGQNIREEDCRPAEPRPGELFLRETLLD